MPVKILVGFGSMGQRNVCPPKPIFITTLIFVFLRYYVILSFEEIERFSAKLISLACRAVSQLLKDQRLPSKNPQSLSELRQIRTTLRILTCSGIYRISGPDTGQRAGDCG